MTAGLAAARGTSRGAPRDDRADLDDVGVVEPRVAGARACRRGSRAPTPGRARAASRSVATVIGPRHARARGAGCAAAPSPSGLAGSGPCGPDPVPGYFVASGSCGSRRASPGSQLHGETSSLGSANAGSIRMPSAAGRDVEPTVRAAVHPLAERVGQTTSTAMRAVQPRPKTRCGRGRGAGGDQMLATRCVASDAPDLDDGALLRPRRRPSSRRGTTTSSEPRSWRLGLVAPGGVGGAVGDAPDLVELRLDVGAADGPLSRWLRGGCIRLLLLGAAPAEPPRPSAPPIASMKIDEQVGHPRPVAGEGVAGLRLQRAQAGHARRKTTPNPRSKRAGEPEADVAAQVLAAGSTVCCLT